MSVANRETRPVIFGLEGTSLTAEEVAFFQETRPWGFILFARNIETRAQIRALTDDLREKSGNACLPIFTDQEGGRVARLKPPLMQLIHQRAPMARCSNKAPKPAPRPRIWELCCWLTTFTNWV